MLSGAAIACGLAGEDAESTEDIVGVDEACCQKVLERTDLRANRCVFWASYKVCQCPRRNAQT